MTSRHKRREQPVCRACTPGRQFPRDCHSTRAVADRPTAALQRNRL